MIDDEQFREMIKGFVEKRGLAVTADSLGVSIPAIERWLAGTSFPHQIIRKAVADFVW